jgi:hypothetical protein
MSKTFSQFRYKGLLDEVANKIIKGGIELTKEYSTNKGKMTDEYEKNNRQFTESFMEYCVKSAGFAWNGIETVKNPQILNSTSFREKFNAIVAQIITPVAPAVISNQYMELAEVKQVGWGETGRFIVKSNELFTVNDVAEGVQLGGLQRLYNDEVTVNPLPKQIRYDIPWYQVAAGIFDFGEWSYKIGASFGGYIQKLIVNTFTGVITDLSGASSPYVANGFSDANFINITQRVQAANGNADVYCMATLAALGTVFPNTVGLQYGLGQQIAEEGFLQKYKGARLVEIEQAMIPGTLNTTATLMIPNTVLYFVAMGQYRPIKVVFEGENVTIESVPTQTPDKTGGLTITMRFGVASVVGSKFGAITGISA